MLFYCFQLVNPITYHKKKWQEKTLKRIWFPRERWNEHYSIIWQFQWYYMDLLKVPRFSYQKRIHNKGHLNLATEVLKGLSPGVFNRLYVPHNKNLEQPKFRTKERANISLFKSNSERYDYQLRQLTGSIPSSIFVDTSWTMVANSDSYQEA